MRLRVLVFLVALLLGSGGMAIAQHEVGDKWEVDGIRYEVTSTSPQEASVIPKKSSSYEGSITIPAKVEKEGKEYSVKTIGKKAFAYCKALKSVTIPNSVTTIGEFAFAYCNALTSVTIPNSVTTIGEFAFGSCKALVTISVDSENPNYESIDGVLFTKGGKTIIHYPARKKEKSYSIPNSVTTIGDYAFAYCDALTSVTIPNSVTTIGEYAFAYCNALTSVYCIAETPPSLDDGAFIKAHSGFWIYVPKASYPQYRAAENWRHLTPFALTITPPSPIAVGETVKLETVVEPSTLALRWESSDETIATVDENGKVKGLKDGVVCISVSPKKFSAPAKCYLAVGTGKLPTGLGLDAEQKTVNVWDEFTLTATVQPADASDKRVSWRSTNPNVATVDALGKVSAIHEGTAKIIATTEIGDYEAECEVTVQTVPVSSVTLSETSKTIKVNESFTLTSLVAPENASNKKVSWESSDMTVASVENGRVKGLKKGTTTITVKTEDGNFTATCEVTVEAVRVTGITLSESSKTITVGEFFTITAMVAPEDATNKTVFWESSDKTVAIVENGKVKGLKPGTATITVQTEEGGFTASCKVTVKEKKANNGNGSSGSGNGNSGGSNGNNGGGSSNPTPVDTPVAPPLSVASNPASSTITLKGLSGRTTIRIYSLDGVLLRTLELEPNASIDIRNLKPRVYLLKAERTTLRFVKK